MVKNTRSIESGVSEAIGFMLIFGMVIVGIGLVTLYGYPLLLQQQVSADEKIMEKNMIVLQNDIKSLAYKTVPFKETALKIGGGSMTVYNSSFGTPSSTIEINNFAGTESYLPPYIPNTRFTPGELRYESMSSQTDISLQNGAVALRRHDVTGSVMLAEPRWFFDSTTNKMVINLINITSTNLMAKEGIGTVQMSLVGEPYFNETMIPVGQEIEIVYRPDVTQDYSVAWDNYIWNSWNIPQSYKISKFPLTPGSGAAMTYRLKNDGSTPMTLITKIFQINIKSI
ncbi:MAG: hypothetical protein WC294_01945 [Methanoregula sp.]|jgi:hypothetical protein